MRMFLVGMCDVFLLLYLTAVAQVDARRVSDITVKDYISLKQQSETKEGERRHTLQELQATKKEAEESVARVRELEALLQSSEREKADDDERVKAARSKLEQAAREAEKAREEAEAAKVREVELTTASEQERAKAAAAREEAERLRAELERQAEEARKRAEEAERLAKQAAADAQAAREETARANQEKSEAAHRAEVSERNAALASTASRIAQQQAAGAQLEATREHEEAERASKERQKVQQQIQAIVQPAARAYKSNIENKLIELTIILERKGIFGTSKDRTTLSVLPVAYGAAQVVFVPRQQVGLENDLDPDTVRRLEFRAGGSQGTALYVSRNAPEVVAIELANVSVAAEPLSSISSLLMPTLIALRNKSRMGLGDRIRSLSEDYFVFKRDHLRRQEAGALRYEENGLRGTGDYAEYLISGDQIVDLNGKFIGIAAKDNLLRQINELASWQRIELDPSRPASAVAELQQPRK